MLARFLFVAAATALATADARGDLTTFPVEYDVLTVTVEHELDVISAEADEAAKDHHAVKNLFKRFKSDTNRDVAFGGITWDAHGQRVDTFLESVEQYVPGFTDAALVKLNETELDFFQFLDHHQNASYDIIYYGASEANAKIGGDRKIARLLVALDKDVKKIAASADTKAFQSKIDTFFEKAKVVSSDFKGLVYDAIGAVYETTGETLDEPTKDPLFGFK